MHEMRTLILGAALLAALTAVHSEASYGGELDISLGRQGVTSLQYDRLELVSMPAPRIRSMKLQMLDGETVDSNSMPTKSSFNAATRKLTLTYDWGSVDVAYKTTGDRLTMTTTVINTSEFVLAEICIELMELVFPGEPDFNGESCKGHNSGSPTVVRLDFGRGVMVVVNEDIGRPLYVGFTAAAPAGGERKKCALLLSTAKHNDLPRGWLQDPSISRPVYPGTSDSYAVSMRFGPAGTSIEALGGDIYERYALAYPFKISWEDRRPIGYLHLDSSEAAKPENQRGWTFMKDPDVKSPEGLVKFKAGLMSYAANAVRILKDDMNAQGMIVWDVEGQEYPHATSYLGDPRSLPDEIDPIIDEFFQQFRDAGLRTGICIRPQRPVRPVYDTNVWQEQLADPCQGMIEKIAHAKKRWGCTLYYVDSNVIFDFVNFRPNQGDAYELTPVSVFQRLTKAHPDVLLIPEHEDVQYFAYTAPHRELRQNYASTPVWASRVYPAAFSIIGVSDGPMDDRRADLVGAVRRGDILLFRAWFDDIFNRKTKSIYEEAAKR